MKKIGANKTRIRSKIKIMKREGNRKRYKKISIKKRRTSNFVKRIEQIGFIIEILVLSSSGEKTEGDNKCSSVCN